MNAVVSELAGLTERYGQLFQVPPYFAYIGRAFGVLEGIGLANDPDYSVSNAQYWFRRAVGQQWAFVSEFTFLRVCVFRRFDALQSEGEEVPQRGRRAMDVRSCQHALHFHSTKWTRYCV